MLLEGEQAHTYARCVLAQKTLPAHENYRLYKREQRDLSRPSPPPPPPPTHTPPRKYQTHNYVFLTLRVHWLGDTRCLCACNNTTYSRREPWINFFFFNVPYSLQAYQNEYTFLCTLTDIQRTKERATSKASTDSRSIHIWPRSLFGCEKKENSYFKVFTVE